MPEPALARAPARSPVASSNSRSSCWASVFTASGSGSWGGAGLLAAWRAKAADVDRGQPPLLEGPAQQPLLHTGGRVRQKPSGSPFSRGTLMKHLFRDKLWPMEFWTQGERRGGWVSGQGRRWGPPSASPLLSFPMGAAGRMWRAAEALLRLGGFGTPGHGAPEPGVLSGAFVPVARIFACSVIRVLEPQDGSHSATLSCPPSPSPAAAASGQRPGSPRAWTAISLPGPGWSSLFVK